MKIAEKLAKSAADCQKLILWFSLSYVENWAGGNEHVGKR